MLATRNLETLGMWSHIRIKAAARVRVEIIVMFGIRLLFVSVNALFSWVWGLGIWVRGFGTRD